MQSVKEIYQKRYVMQTNIFRPRFDAKEIYFDYIKILSKKFDGNLNEDGSLGIVLNEQYKYVVGQISLWYANDTRLVGDLRKGILLRGGIGTGKTKIIEALIDVFLKGEKRVIKMIHTRDLQDLYMRQKVDEIQLLKESTLLLVDDLGVENVEVQYFGNRIEPFNDLFDYRYRHGLQTVVTTNLAPSEIKAIYGDRILDRLKEVMNDLVLDYKSFRK